MALRKYLLTRVRGIARVHVFLARWWADAREAAYAPGGAGYARARASFETNRVALQLAELRARKEEAEDKMQTAVDDDDFEAASELQELVDALADEIDQLEASL